jgi:NhaA family Na+:H+ antiporter
VPEHRDVSSSPGRRRRRVPLVQPLQEFLRESTSSSWVLVAAVVAALVWVNSPWGASYDRLWATPLALHVGGLTIGSDLAFWISSGLMTFFFLVVGLEIKREVTIGELRRPKAVALPAIAAVGGMVVPALLYLAIVGGGPAGRGWGVPIATDIALALGTLALAARHAPAALKPLLLTLAIVDDVGAIVVIAVFYSHGGRPPALAVALLVVAAVIVLERLHVRATWVFVGLGIVLWVACDQAGIHPTIAGVVMGVLTPVHPRPHEEVAPLARTEHLLLPWTSFVIVPLFALSSAGVHLSPATVSAALGGVVAAGVLVGLVIGKPIGVVGASLLARWTGVGEAPAEIGTRALLGLGATAGIGFTVGLFIAELAFATEPLLLAEAKIALLCASVVAGAFGYAVLRGSGQSARSDPR